MRPFHFCVFPKVSVRRGLRMAFAPGSAIACQCLEGRAGAVSRLLPELAGRVFPACLAAVMGALKAMECLGAVVPAALWAMMVNCLAAVVPGAWLAMECLAAAARALLWFRDFPQVAAHPH